MAATFKPELPGYEDEARRVPWVDAAKGLCIVLVVMMHATLGTGEAMAEAGYGSHGFMHWVVAYAQPFRMPDFFLVSGLFLARVIDRDWRSYADKRVVHFVYFYLLWLVIQSLFKFGSVSDGTALGFLEHLAFSLVEPYSTLWFVYILAVFSVVTKLLRPLPPMALLAGAAVLQILPVETGWFLADEFASRYVYFVAGFVLAPQIFRLAERALAERRKALALLALWAGLNGFFALTPTNWAHYPTLASLPLVSLALGAAGAVAIVMFSALIAGSRWAVPLTYAGRHSIAIYLAFFLPMAAARTVLIKTGFIADVGLVSLIVTLAAVVAPLVLERMVRHSPARFLFERPAWAGIEARRARVRLQPAE